MHPIVNGCEVTGSIPEIQSTAVADTIDATVVVVAEEERSVWHLIQVGRPAPHLSVLQPSFGKGLVLWVLSAKGNHHHAGICADVVLLAAIANPVNVARAIRLRVFKAPPSLTAD